MAIQGQDSLPVSDGSSVGAACAELLLWEGFTHLNHKWSNEQTHRMSKGFFISIIKKMAE